MNSPSREAKNSSKNLLMSYENDAKKASINNSGLPKLNNELGSPQKSTFSKNQKEKGETKYNNTENNNNLEEKNFIIEKKLNDRNEENKVIFNSSDELFLSKGDFNESEKINIIGIKNEDDNNDNNKDNAIENINRKKLLDIEKYIKLPVNKNNEKENKKDKIRFLDKGTDGEYLSKINNQMKNNKNINEKLSNKKITIMVYKKTLRKLNGYKPPSRQKR